MKAEDLLKKYAAGERSFSGINLSEANLSGANLSGANLSGANLSVANLSGANLSNTNLSRAKLNVAKLSGANLSKANMQGAILNVANLTLADLSGAELGHASLVRAELNRADLSGANLNQANFSGADLKDAKLRNVNLANANLSRADLKWTTFTAANLTQANLHGTDMSSADFSGADLGNTELRQANLSRTVLKGTNLSGANLRWADLSGADLSSADLSGARLSGANLTGANLSNAALLGTTLVHVDLTRANLIGVDWAGADLSGATLTGAKLHGAPRFGIKTDGIICEWVDLSVNGDQSNIYRFGPDDLQMFFHETAPTVRIVIEATLDHDAHYVLAESYRQIRQRNKSLFNPPNLKIGRRRTILTFELDSDDQLFLMSFIAILPFKDALQTHQNAIALVQALRSEGVMSSISDPDWQQQIGRTLEQVSTQASQLKLPEAILNALDKVKFFHVATKTILINSSNQSLTLYCHPSFGKRVSNSADPMALPTQQQATILPSPAALAEFIQGFHRNS